MPPDLLLHLIPSKNLFLLHIYVIILFTSPVLFAQSDNLVANPSFEQAVDFNSYGSTWMKCLKNDSPDYIEFSSRGRPDFYYRKYIGGLLPYDGNAYVGIFCYRINPLRGIENVREFIQAPLFQTLAKDTIYTVSLMIALDPESTNAINNFNVYFTSSELSLKQEEQMYALKSQIRFNTSPLDSISWMKLETDYRALGYESYIILGNMMPDDRIRKLPVHYESQMASKWNLHELEQASYYYIDDVSVVKKSHKEDQEAKSERLSEIPVISVESRLLQGIDPDSISTDSSIVLNNIFFEFDKSILLPTSYKELDELVSFLKAHSDKEIVIEGHTDNLGTYEYNISLSLERAYAVIEYLISQGIPESRLSTEGYGYTRPVSNNRSEEGRQMNRRVAFRIKN